MATKTSSSETSTPRGRGVERRAAVRHYFSLSDPNEAVAVIGDRQWRARVRDLSTTGVGLLCTRREEPGTFLAVELQSGDRSLRYTLPVRVVHALAQPNGRYLLGCEFVRALSEEELQSLL